MKKKEYHINEINSGAEEAAILYGHSEANESNRRRQAILMSDMEKFRLYCRMMRISKMLSTAKVTHKKMEE